MKRREVLEAACAAIMVDRARDHGEAENNFGNIARGWDWWLSMRPEAVGNLTPFDVSCMMSIFKLARMATNPGHADSAADLCGYGAIAGELGERHGKTD